MTNSRAIGQSNVTQRIFEIGRKVVVATKHKKEQVIAPILSQSFQFECIVSDIDTDRFGTFSGEIDRTLSPLEAARKKCHMAMEACGLDLAISSEGSFGGHPFIPFCQADEELVLLVDRKNNLEIVGKELTMNTNLSGQFVSSYTEALGFARKCGFPRHGLILRETESKGQIFIKGLSDVSTLRSKMEYLLPKHQKIWLETDMRAMYNPTRMRAIEKATLNLVKKMNSLCPSCSMPGYWIQKANEGLPCSYCDTPTRSTLSFEYGCLKCGHVTTIKNPNGREAEDPMYCDHCNP